MCGICGQFNFMDHKPVVASDIQKMSDSIFHRGPDDEGMYISNSLGLGFRRLSIIDLSGGHQPMSDKDKSVWVVFNGEIYNLIKVKKELESFGHVFKTRCDTEVIVHGYKQWGNDVLNHLNGMFGLAIWDEKKRKLLLARDRMGIKLVYYRIDKGSLLFGSELRSILSVIKEKPEIDTTSVNLFLRYRYTPSPLTIFKNIYKLAPGTCLIIENGKSEYKRWYNFEPVPFVSMPSINQAKEELLSLYQKAVKRQLISDVPLGLLLSGGLDSGLLLALMNNNNERYSTYTIGYGKSFQDDELIQAAETADILNSPNYSIKLSREEFENSLPKIIKYLEEPIASSSIVPMYHICKRAREDVKVAIVGQGPDELFGGYIRHLGVHYSQYWRLVPDKLRRLLEIKLAALPRNETIKRGLYSLHIEDRLKKYQQIFSILEGETVNNLFQKDILPPKAGDKIVECWQYFSDLMSHTDDLGGFQFLEIRSSLPDELLMYADKLSMANHLEIRVPFLDHDIVEYTECLSASFKIRLGQRKWLHRKVCNDYLPKKILKRRKIGFAVKVVDSWFQNTTNSKITTFLTDSDSYMYRFLEKDAVLKLIEEHQTGRNDNHKILFSLVAFEEWLRSFFSNYQ